MKRYSNRKNASKKQPDAFRRINRRSTTRNKELTKALILQAASRIIIQDGFKKLGVNKIAKAAGRSKKMIYDYYGGVDGILEKLLEENDHLLSFEDRLEQTILENSLDCGKNLTKISFEKHFKKLKSNPILQQLGLLELNDNPAFLDTLSIKRELMTDKLFSISEDYFKNTDVHFRVVCALLGGGLNYLVLRSKKQSTPYHGIDINKPSDQERLIETINLLIDAAYDKAKKS